MKTILALHGSPRKNGNSIYLAHQAIAEAEKQKAIVEQVYLHDSAISPCKGCDACRKKIPGHCIIKDDMQSIYKKIIAADVLLLSSPIYWFTYAGQLKICFDRFYAIQTPHLSALKGKKVGIVLTYGDVDPFMSGTVNAVRTLQDAFNYVGAEIVGTVYGTANGIGDVQKNQWLIAQARELGKILAQ